MSLSKKLAIVAVVLLLLIGLVFGLKFATPHIRDLQQKSTSDAATTKGTITVLVDDWIGYAPLCSLEMKRLMKESGYNFTCEDDGADYPKRMERIQKREVQFAVGTVDTDVLTGATHSYPGAITAVIDQSKGADALLCYKAKYANLDALKGAANLRLAYTPSSPSHHFVKAIADHFAIPLLGKTTQRIETKGSEEAMKALLENKADCAVLWEPNIGKAIEKGAGNIIELLSTKSTERLIVDVLVAERSYANANPVVMKMVHGNYFRALKTYRDDQAKFKKEIMDTHHLSADKAEAMIRGVEWATLEDNAERWFGVATGSARGQEGIIATIDSTVRILQAAGDFTSNPLPSKDPYRLINSEYIADLAKNGVSGFTVPGTNAAAAASTGLDAQFTAISEEQWKNLRPVGTLRVDPVTFARGSDDLTLDGKEQLDQIAEKLKHYPAFRILVKGHTGFSGDPAANLALSQARAEAVVRYFAVTYSVSEARVHAVGRGSEEPPKECAGRVDDQDCGYRMPRVEVTLVKETL